MTDAKTGIWSDLVTLIETKADTVVKRARDAFFEQVNETTVRLAVTGLSRAGKTVFITALIHNLMAQARGHGVLPDFVRDGIAERLRRVEILPHPDGDGPEAFPYATMLTAMAASPPHWPERTQELAILRLRLVLERRSAMAGALLGERAVILELMDYPGEWLLDLPLLQQDYRTWSDQTLADWQSPAKAAMMAPFLAALAAHDPRSASNLETATRLITLYRDGLRMAQSQGGFSFLQPAALIAPGPQDPADFFCPVPPGPLAATMAEQFTAYQTRVRTRFADPHMRRVDRQVILVDLLGALSAGEAAFNDLTRSLAAVADTFRYADGWLDRLWGGRILRVAVAATKADYVPARQRDALPVLLDHLLFGTTPRKAARARGDMNFFALAATRCTRDDVAELGGHPVQVVCGLPMDQDQPVKFYPGEIPLRPPGPEFWQRPFFRLPIFQPPVLDPTGHHGVPHLGIDDVLGFLLGDCL